MPFCKSFFFPVCFILLVTSGAFGVQTAACVAQLKKAQRKIAAVASYPISGIQPEHFPMASLVIASEPILSPISKAHAAISAGVPNKVKLRFILPQDNTQEQKKIEIQKTTNKLEWMNAMVPSLWVRDFLPELIKNPDGTWNLVRFQYQQGANPYSNSHAQISSQVLAKKMRLPLIESNLIIEGGNLASDQQGRLFLSDSVLFRNPTESKESIERELKALLHPSEIVWLKRLPGEPTGHIDIFLKFFSKNRVVVAQSFNATKASVLDETASLLSQKGMEVFRIPLPETDGGTLIFSYTNVAEINGTLFIPSYLDAATTPAEKKLLTKSDQEAETFYRDLGFISIIVIPAGDLSRRGGGVHCMTKQYPVIK